MMKLISGVVLALMIAVPAVPQDAAEPRPADDAVQARLELLAVDLRALDRIANLSKDPADQKQLMLALLDENIEELRGPRGDGTYRWASLEREETGRTTRERDVERVHTEEALDLVTVGTAHPYRVVVNVTPKRSLFSSNNKVFVRNVMASGNTLDGREITEEVDVSVWIEPGNSHAIPLPRIYRNALVSVYLGVESGEKKAFAEVALLQAKLVDDPISPYFTPVVRLLAIREAVEAYPIRMTALEQAIDEAVVGIPGELAASLAIEEAMAARRRDRMERAKTLDSIVFGDATPDVIAELETVRGLSEGTLEQQAEARRRIDVLITKLRGEKETEAATEQQ